MNSRIIPCGIYGKQTWQDTLFSPFLILLFLPLALSLIQVSTPWGIHLHFFQIAILFGAYFYGPVGGGIAGAAGAFAGALILSNPYIIVGNVILGTAAGYFARLGFRPIFAMWSAFLIQLPWLILSDYCFMGLSATFLPGLIVSLFLSNTLWALVVTFAFRLFRRYDA